MSAFDPVRREELLLQLPAEGNIGASQGPIVRYQLLSHPSATLVKRIELQADGSFIKKIGGQIPRGATISTRTATLRNYVEEAFDGGVKQYVLPANLELGTAIPISPKEFVVEDGVDRTAATLKYVEGPA